MQNKLKVNLIKDFELYEFNHLISLYFQKGILITNLKL